MNKTRSISIFIIILISIILAIYLFFKLLILTNEEYSILGVFSTFILGIFTLIASFQNEIRSLWFKPKFKITYDEKFISREGSEDYHKIKIENIGNAIAKNCFIRVNEVTRIPDKKTIMIDPVNLKWSGFPFNKNNISRSMVNIPSNGGYELFDLLIVRNNLSGKISPESDKYLSNPFDFYIRGSKMEIRELYKVKGQLEFIFSIVIYSYNSDPEYHKIRFYKENDKFKIKIE